MDDRTTIWMRLLLAAIAAAILVSCASIGRPEGGIRDEIPPAFVSSNPAPGSLNFSGSRLTVTFDENITLDDPSNKIVISPPQQVPPRISSNARRVTIELQDTLLSDMTYTVDFADAVRDLNESNVLDGFALDFSTGATLDTLSISGMVLEARTLEPAQGMMVGVYSVANFADTTLTTTRLERITKTNQLGQFVVRNLKPQPYRIYALNDLNRDFHWDRSEDVAFLDLDITPTSEPAEWPDTLVDALGRDSIVMRPVTRFLPDNVLLTWFNEDYKSRYMLKNERPERRKLSLIFSAPADSMPQMRVVGGSADGHDFSRYSVAESSVGRDSITYWITDTTLMAADSLKISTRYLFTDSLDHLSWKTDTIPFILRGQKKKAKEKEKKKEQTDTAATDSVATPPEFISFSLKGGGNQELNLGLLFSAATPIASLDSSAVRMEMMVDTTWQAVMPPRIVLTDSLNPREFHADYQWRPATRYRLSIDSASIHDVYGLHNKPIVQEFTTKSPEDYSAIFFTVSGLPDSVQAIVELLGSNDKPVKSVPVVNDVATLDYLSPTTYYARLYIDTNGNGCWDTGNIADNLQPEDVYYFPKKLTLKKNWDIEQAWDINSTPVDLQKPLDIKKNKPKKKQWDDENTNSEEEETDELWDTYSRDPFFQNPNLNTTGNRNSMMRR